MYACMHYSSYFFFFHESNDAIEIQQLPLFPRGFELLACLQTFPKKLCFVNRGFYHAISVNFFIVFICLSFSYFSVIMVRVKKQKKHCKRMNMIFLQRKRESRECVGVGVVDISGSYGNGDATIASSATEEGG